MPISILKGNLIESTQDGMFDVIAHGCNCFCRMKRGIAPLMHEAFGCNNPDLFSMEKMLYEGDINKLGNIEGKSVLRNKNYWLGDNINVIAVNMYSQYHWNEPCEKSGVPLDYDALTLCLRKLNTKYVDKHIGLPGLIGCGLAGGISETVLRIIADELKNCEVGIMYIDETKIPEYLK